MNRLKEHYEDVIRPYMMIKYNYKSIMELPKINKICIHMTYRNISNEKSHIIPSKLILELITGQKPCDVRAKKSIASFKLRKGNLIACKVTLRNNNMYEFIDKLTTTVFPRIRNFNGISKKNFDGKGNYTFGIKNFLCFQEIEMDYNLFEGIYGMDIQIITSCKNDKEAISLLNAFKIPFIK